MEAWQSFLLTCFRKTKIMASGPITSWKIDGEQIETVTDFISLGSKITADGDCSREIKRHLLFGRKTMTNLDSIVKKQRHYFANKGPSGQGYGFSSSHIWMWELDHKESWALKNWYFWTVVLERTLERPLDCKEIQPVHPKGNQSFLLRKLKLPILCTDRWGRLSYLSLLFFGTLHSNGYIFPFVLCFLLPFSVMSNSLWPQGL